MATFHDNVVSAEAPSKILVKNATLWRWSQSSSSLSRTGSAIPCSWFCIEKGLVSNISSISGDIREHPLESSFTKVIDAKDQLVIPGLHDAHIHVCMTGESSYFLNLSGCDSIDKLVSVLSSHSSKFPTSTLPWIQGVNWDQTDLGRYPTKEDLDRACPDRPVFLWRACWHIGVANTRALQLAGVIKGCVAAYEGMTTDLDLVLSPPGGAIDIGSDSIPTGILRERAVELVVSVMGKKSQAEMTSFISEGLSQCVRKGLTAVQTNDVAALHSYRKLLQENSLPLRVFLTPNYEELNAVDLKSSSSEICSGGVGSAEWDCRPSRPSCMPSSSARITATKKASHNDDITHLPYSESTVIDLSTSRSRLVVERVKIYADGSLGAETAALRTTDILASSSQIDIGSDENRHVTDYISLPLLDLAQAGKNKDKGYTGILTHSKDDLKNMVSHARDLNFRVEVHAIGDAAAEQVLTSFEGAGVLPSERPVLTHCQVLGDDLIHRMSLGGVIANVQPSFVPTDMRWVQKRLTPSQQKYSYAWKTLLDRGVTVAGGSDAPIETCSPLVGMFDAIHRQARSSAVSEGEDVEARSDSQAADTSPSLNAAGEHDSPESEIFRPEERLSFAEALWIYTVGAALAAGCEHFLGSLETGYAADFVILDVAVLDQHALLQTTEPLLVVVGGSESYRKTTGSEGVGTLTDISTEEGRSAATMGGPYIPGKNGPRPSKRRQKRVDADADGALGPVCACRLLGKYCSVVYR